MKTLTALFLLVSLFINSLFASLVGNSDYELDSLALKSKIGIPSDSIIDIDSLLNDTVLFKEVSSDTLINSDSLINADTLNITSGGKVLSDTVVVKKDTVSKPSVPKKPVVVIPKSVIELNKIYSDYRKYSEWAQDRWDDIYLSLSDIQMKSDYYKFVVPLTYYSKAFEEASTVEKWYPKDILVEDSVRKAAALEKGMPHMPISSELDRRINRQLLDFYVNYPELVLKNETSLDSLDFLSYEDMTSAYKEDDIISLIDNNAGFAQMAGSELLVLKPNFWTYGGNGYLQFSQNYISENWYKGGESTKSLLSGFTWQIKYDDKQKTQFEGKLEWKLGFITAPSDTVHSYKANNDLLRLTSKLGYKAIQNWYYTLSAEFQTQFFSNYATNSDNLVSALFSPATLNVGLGMDYKFVKDGKVNLSVLLNPINYTLYSIMDDRLDPTKFNIKEGHKRENEIGSRINATLTWKIIPSLLWESKFSYTTNYEKVFSEWENTFTFVVNKYLSTKLFMHGRYDDGVSKDPDESYFQFQELFSFGLNYTW
ncbi:DUF3078 domain-containing protein [uncultured Bacteroides sp.]|uniref:DUF3078 domain-containing protein n=1 Tax=uncultured Bacteroides sp. TaxID=162156 RepID=UPI0025E2F04A|nr:DUF3078 domain-containing protein [uncultured Bacteroides sp.]